MKEVYLYMELYANCKAITTNILFIVSFRPELNCLHFEDIFVDVTVAYPYR